MSESSKIENTRPEGVKPATRMTCMPGQVICAQGTPSHQAYFVEEGLVEVVVEEDGHSVKLAEIGAGEVFGEMGVLESEARMATVRAVERSKITIMSKEELQARIDAIGDPVVEALVRGYARRLRAASAGQVKYFKHFAAFQDRMAGLMHKANAGIDTAKREAFAAEIVPLLDKIEATLDKYRQ